MILSYTITATGLQLDQVTIKGSTVTYKTGKARKLFAASIKRYGVKATTMMLRDWSNGYVSISEKV